MDFCSLKCCLSFEIGMSSLGLQNQIEKQYKLTLWYLSILENKHNTDKSIYIYIKYVIYQINSDIKFIKKSATVYVRKKQPTVKKFISCAMMF